MPAVTSGNINAAVIGWRRRAADLISRTRPYNRTMWEGLALLVIVGGALLWRIA